MTYRVVGHCIPRVDGVEKVTGRASYASDLVVPGMLSGAVARSSIPHGRIRAIDTSGAERLPGVVAVLTRDDVRDIDPYYGHVIKDRPLIAIDKVRYIGEPVAAVAAVDELTAHEAAGLIKIEYEGLPAVFDAETAFDQAAPQIHERAQRHNICFHRHHEQGDVTRALATAPHLFVHRFTFPSVYHYAMEPHTVIATMGGTSITVWSSAQHPFLVRADLATMFGRTLEEVRVIVPYVGGGFGSKSYTKIEPLVVALARKAGRPVRVALSVPEACLTSRRHAATLVLRSGLDDDGRFLARECTIWLDTGAYADNGPRVAAKAAMRVLGAYRCNNVRVDAYAMYTNTVPAGSFRSIGGPQAIWANESHFDMIAQALAIDPVDLRLRNLLSQGERVQNLERPLDADLHDGLRRVAAAIGWSQPRREGTGRGVALGVSDSGADPVATAIVRLHDDGSATVHESSTEIGQGVRTILAQIAAEELAVPLARIGLIGSDTGSTPYDRSTGASRSTTVMGLAVQEACRDLRAQLAAMAAEQLGASASDISFQDGKAIHPDGRERTYGEVVRTFYGITGGELVGRGYVRGGTAGGTLRAQPIVWEIGWGAAEASVDRETGEVQLLRYVAAADVGKAINPQLAEGQDEGAAMMGIGHTLYEALHFENGQLLNGNLVDYRVPLITDLPSTFETVLLENANGPGPYGAKGMGEGAINPVAPAVAQAVAQAFGVRITDLPLTPERVWRALRERTAQPDTVKVR